MTRFENVGVFIREKVWLEPDLSPALYVTMACTGTILTLRGLMSYIHIYIYIYIYGAPILDVSRSHTTTQHSR